MNFYDDPIYNSLTKDDWLTAIFIGTGWDKEVILAILAEADLDYDRDGRSVCTAAVLKWGRAKLREQSN